jgi:hypothetical protein
VADALRRGRPGPARRPAGHRLGADRALGLGQLVGADPIGVLRTGVLGQALLVLGVGLAAAGMAWSERILRAAVPR